MQRTAQIVTRPKGDAVKSLQGRNVIMADDQVVVIAPGVICMTEELFRFVFKGVRKSTLSAQS